MARFVYKNKAGKNCYATSEQILDRFYDDYIDVIKWFGIIPSKRSGRNLSGEIQIGKAYTKHFQLTDETILKMRCIKEFMSVYNAKEVKHDKS